MAKRKYSENDYTTNDEGSEFEDSVPKLPKKDRASRKRRKNSSVDADEHSGDGLPHSLSRHAITSPELICTALLDWYAGVHESRGMPWRKPYDPSLGQDGRSQRAYEVWVSEVMLQQTQVTTVIPYYNKWMKRYPTVKDLAASDIETVNGLWKGLGYYSRASRLLRGAKYVMNELGGKLPLDAGVMQAKIPGIGRYSAGAICSIAYNQQVPVLDGNVHRLLSRFLALYAPPKAKNTLDILWSRATLLVENTDRPGNLNQALIELGSVVCKVRGPSCAICPIRTWCQAYQGAQDQPTSQTVDIPDIEEVCSICDPLPEVVPVTIYPMKTKRKAVREEIDAVNVVEWRCPDDNERWFLLVRRPGKGLLAGLQEFPTLPNVSHSHDLEKIPHILLSKLLLKPPQSHSVSRRKKTNDASDPPDDTDTLRITTIKPAEDVIHVFSHIKKTYRLQWVVLEGGGIHPPKLCSGPISKAQSIKEAKEDCSTIDGNHEAKDPQSIPVPSDSKWVPIHGVTDSNIGSGVLKIWNQVKVLWEDALPRRY